LYLFRDQPSIIIRLTKAWIQLWMSLCLYKGGSNHTGLMVLELSNSGIAGSNPARSMIVCLGFCVLFRSVLDMGLAVDPSIRTKFVRIHNFRILNRNGWARESYPWHVLIKRVVNVFSQNSWCHMLKVFLRHTVETFTISLLNLQPNAFTCVYKMYWLQSVPK